MSAHTPGPWQIIRESQDAVITYSDGELRSHIARIYDTTLCPEHGTVDGNACLIAAAPRMLEALESIADTLEDMPFPVDQRMGKRVESDIREARAAIAQARGETND